MQRENLSALRLACLLLPLFMVGCGPTGALRGLFEDDPGNGEGGGPEFTFQMPAEGETVDSVTPIAVTGTELARAQFVVDGDLVFEALAAPFEWDLDPANHVLGVRELTVVGITSSGSSDSKSVSVVVERAVPLSEIHEAIDNLQPSHWYEIPNSRLRAVGWSDPNDYRGNLEFVMREASGGAYDSKRDRLIVFGGGQGYSGNEIYAFDLATAAWIRLTDPSAFPDSDPDNSAGAASHPDGSPVSRHTYDFIEYIPDPVDRLYVGGGSAVYGQNSIDTQVWLFDFETLTWSVGGTDLESAGYGSVAAVDSAGIVWQQGAGGSGLTSFDPKSGRVQMEVEWDGWYDYMSTAAYDPVNNDLVAVGGGLAWLWDLDDPSQKAVALSTTGPTAVLQAQNPGFVHEPKSGLMVGWAGGPSVFTLDLDTGTWEQVGSSGSVDPGPQTRRGSFGRFRYVASKEVFIVTSSVDRNVFVYRLPSD